MFLFSTYQFFFFPPYFLRSKRRLGSFVYNDPTFRVRYRHLLLDAPPYTEFGDIPLHIQKDFLDNYASKVAEDRSGKTRKRDSPEEPRRMHKDMMDFPKPMQKPMNAILRHMYINCKSIDMRNA